MATISRNHSLYLLGLTTIVLIFTVSYQVAELSGRLSAILTMKRSKKLSRSGWRDRQISILVELTVCQKNVANALNSVEILWKKNIMYVVCNISILLYGQVAELFERPSKHCTMHRPGIDLIPVF